MALWALNAYAAARPGTIPLRHKHLRKGGTGELSVGVSTITFREIGKSQNHSREWAFDEIKQLYVSPNIIRVVTYEDVAWQLGKDREYKFDEVPKGAAQTLVSVLRGRMDNRRLVAALADSSIKPLWQIKAKLVRGRAGSEGIVLVGEDSVVYNSGERDASRTWMFRQIENISSSGPFDLTITAFEQDGAQSYGRRDFRFQLKTELSEQRYNALWRRLNHSRLLQSSTLDSSKER